MDVGEPGRTEVRKNMTASGVLQIVSLRDEFSHEVWYTCSISRGKYARCYSAFDVQTLISPFNGGCACTGPPVFFVGSIGLCIC